VDLPSFSEAEGDVLNNIHNTQEDEEEYEDESEEEG